MKLIKSSGINPFGGMNFIYDQFEKLNLSDLLDAYLPTLASQSCYSWSDILYSFWTIYFCGGDSIEDIDINIGSYFSKNKFFKVPGPDCILRRFKELSEKPEHFKTLKGKADHQFCLNDNLNNLCVALLNKLNAFTESNLTLDYDNTIIQTKKSDSRKTYMKCFGYNPALATIGNNVVYVENRNGNSDSRSLQYETLARAFKILDQQNISIANFRADAASYTFNLFKFILTKVENIFIAVPPRFARSYFHKDLNWTKIKRSDNIESYVSEVNFTPFIQQAVKSKEKHLLRECRLVITKRRRKDGRIDLFTNDDFEYHSVMTTNDSMTPQEVLQFYRQRGSMENRIGVLKQDFGWSNLPFSKIEENNVFLILSAICNNIYNYIVTYFAKKVKGIKENFQIKKFLFRFIIMPCKWIRSGRQNKLKVYRNINFNP